MKQKGSILIIVLILLGISVLFAPLPYYQSEEVACKIGQICPKVGWHLKKSIALSLWESFKYSTESTSEPKVPTLTPFVSPQPSPEEETPSSGPISGWKVYKNETYGFEISYPEKYKVLTDKENLYGWPKAVALIYAGGQAYDIAIEVWKTEAEYQAKYTSLQDLTVKKVGENIITLLDATKKGDNAKVIASFRFTE
jgi:hypothetical protein